MKKIKEPIFFYILIRHWKAFEYFDRCINSVLNQTYKNYKILFVDDASGYTKQQKEYIRRVLQEHQVIFNKVRKYAVRNAYEIIHQYCDNIDAVIVNLDGDDWLYNSSALQFLSNQYSQYNIDATYGECMVWNGKSISNKPSRNLYKFTNIKYKANVIKNRSYRIEPFLPLHPMTWKIDLYKRIRNSDFKDPNNNWLKFTQDQSIMYPILEMAQKKVRVISQPLYVYNTSETNHDINKNKLGLIRDEIIIRKKVKYEPIF
jgi:glycosyltransferase involved in cell wall biosynthesis